ncbi:MAG: hypothetical protein IPF84_08260 [Proteobacteria bacterium]|nr:hypothetical protein [Pseudomonadota bacterium]
MTDEIRLADSEEVFLCLSVLGNLETLVHNGYMDRAWISDDIVFKLGEVSHEDVSEIVSKVSITRHGAYFPSIRIPRAQISFRPRFFRDADINFIDLRKNFDSASPLDYTEKALRALFLRYGVRMWTPARWSVYVQYNFDHLYQLTRDGVEEVHDAREQFDAVASRLASDVRKMGFETFVANVCNVMSGIHLSYDRRVLSDVPRHIAVFDTSLENVPGDHSALRAFCAAYLRAKHVGRVP